MAGLARAVVHAGGNICGNDFREYFAIAVCAGLSSRLSLLLFAVLAAWHPAIAQNVGDFYPRPGDGVPTDGVLRAYPFAGDIAAGDA